MHSYEIGKVYYFEGAVWSWIGKLIQVSATDFLLEAGACKVFEEGVRFSEFVSKGPSSESQLERAKGKTILTRSMVSNATEWFHNIPKTQ